MAHNSIEVVSQLYVSSSYYPGFAIKPTEFFFTFNLDDILNSNTPPVQILEQLCCIFQAQPRMTEETLIRILRWTFRILWEVKQIDPTTTPLSLMEYAALVTIKNLVFQIAILTDYVIIVPFHN